MAKEDKTMKNNNKTQRQVKIKPNIIIVAIIGIAVLLIIYFIFVEFAGEKVPTSDLKQTGEAGETEQMQEINRQAVENAQGTSINKVRSVSEEDHIIGKLDAPVQLIIYCDFECPFCAQFSDTVNQIKDEFGDKVVIAFRHFPLRSHFNAISAAITSECASEQGKFWEMHDKLFADNKAGRMGVEQYKKDAEELELDLVKFNQCLDTEQYKDKIEAQLEEAKSFGVTGTPGNFVNGEPIPGAYPLEDFTDSQGNKREGMKSIINRHLN